MITREDYYKAGGVKKHRVYDIDIDCWTKEVFYIFVRNDSLFLRRKPVAEDFIQKVRIKIIGVYNKKNFPYVIKCKNSFISYGVTREQSEVFLSSKEIENSEEMKKYLNGFLINYKKLLLESNRYLQGKLKEIKEDIEKNITQIDITDDLIKNE